MAEEDGNGGRPREPRPIRDKMMDLRPEMRAARRKMMAASPVWEMMALCVGALAVALVEQIPARLSGLYPGKPHRGKPHLQFLWHGSWDWTLFSSAMGLVVLCIVSFCLAKRSRSEGVFVYLNAPRTRQVMASFIAGTTLAALVRLGLGDISSDGFAGGSSPIIAGIVIGVIVSGLAEPGKPVAPYRRVALMYLFLGALATALGSIGVSGWFVGSCFIVIFGGLTASAYLVVDLVLRVAPSELDSTPARAEAASSSGRGTSP